MQTVITNTGYKRTIELLSSEYEKLSSDGCFFALVRTEYDEKGNAVHDFLDVLCAATELGYEYVNTIVYPMSDAQRVAFADNVKYVVWLCKNHSEMKFNKDAIREKHIWKDVEWGKRAKNYSPKGKDPGNVWIPTEDDGNAHITNHIMLDDEGVIARILAMSDCQDDYVLYQDTPSSASARLTQAEPSHHSERAKSRVIFKSSEDMSTVEDETIKAVITSPPYWNLKDYFKKGQIGQEGYEEYLNRMEVVLEQCYKKLTSDGSLWININIRVQGGRVIPIPRDFVKICRKIGFFYKGIVIWHKSSGIPTSDKNIADHHEYVMIFSKKEDFSVKREELSAISDYKNSKMNGAAFWNINRKAGSVGKKYIHPAIYPNELVARIIKIVTEKGETVLDPFLGSGTTLIAAEQNGRMCIGYEYNEGFQDLITSRLLTDLGEAKIPFEF